MHRGWDRRLAAAVLAAVTFAATAASAAPAAPSPVSCWRDKSYSDTEALARDQAILGVLQARSMATMRDSLSHFQIAQALYGQLVAKSYHVTQSRAALAAIAADIANGHLVLATNGRGGEPPPADPNFMPPETAATPAPCPLGNVKIAPTPATT